MQRAFYVILLAALCCTACNQPTTNATTQPAASPTASDQAAAPRQRYWVTETHVKPEMMTPFREFYLNETLPAAQKGGIKQQSVWITAAFGEAFEYVTIRPIEGLQQFDEASPMLKALGEEGVRQWAAKRATMIVRSRSYIMQARPEISLAPDQAYIPKLAFVTRASIAPGRSLEHENYIKTDVLPILKKANPKGQLVNKVAQGGDTELYITATLLDSFADYDKWAAALQKEGYGNVVAKRAGIMSHRESAVYRFVPELSLPQPPAPTAAK